MTGSAFLEWRRLCPRRDHRAGQPQTESGKKGNNAPGRKKLKIGPLARLLQDPREPVTHPAPTPDCSAAPRPNCRRRARRREARCRLEGDRRLGCPRLPLSLRRRSPRVGSWRAPARCSKRPRQLQCKLQSDRTRELCTVCIAGGTICTICTEIVGRETVFDVAGQRVWCAVALLHRGARPGSGWRPETCRGGGAGREDILTSNLHSRQGASEQAAGWRGGTRDWNAFEVECGSRLEGWDEMMAN